MLTSLGTRPKITPGVGLLWFAVRRDWQALRTALAVTAGIARADFQLQGDVTVDISKDGSGSFANAFLLNISPSQAAEVANYKTLKIVVLAGAWVTRNATRPVTVMPDVASAAPGKPCLRQIQMSGRKHR